MCTCWQWCSLSPCPIWTYSPLAAPTRAPGLRFVEWPSFIFWQTHITSPARWSPRAQWCQQWCKRQLPTQAAQWSIRTSEEFLFYSIYSAFGDGFFFWHSVPRSPPGKWRWCQRCRQRRRRRGTPASLMLAPTWKSPTNPGRIKKTVFRKINKVAMSVTPPRPLTWTPEGWEPGTMPPPGRPEIIFRFGIIIWFEIIIIYSLKNQIWIQNLDCPLLCHLNQSDGNNKPDSHMLGNQRRCRC